MIIRIKDLKNSEFEEVDLRIFKSRLLNSVEKLKETNPTTKNTNNQIEIFESDLIPNQQNQNEKKDDKSEYDVRKRAHNYVPVEPNWTFDKLIIPDKVLDNINTSLSILQLEKKVFQEWGLREIEPFPRAALNFHGSPGTGKTLAAHAIANKLGKKIIITNYAQLESMYHGVGPKNIDAVFYAADSTNSVLFIDEADSLLSKRLLNVNQGSEQAINSMRSQLLINLERFSGICIFATNLVENYDYAFETRVKHVLFILPNEDNRKRIWDIHLLPSIPVNDNVDTQKLAEEFDSFCGRDIKNAVIEACLRAAKEGSQFLDQTHLVSASENIVESIKALNESKGDSDRKKNSEVSQEKKNELADKIKKKLAEKEEE
ncbi:MAG: ATP-binding protein [Saprospiraceae bacterium]|nr:ATP-binding protein [Saprospiraceae bacterium]